MNLPQSLSQRTEWTFVGPLGSTLPDFLLSHPVLGVDGGAHFTSKLDLWVGDADSFSERPQTQHTHILPVDKDASDLNFALQLFSAAKPYKFHFWGFLGGRKDHELFNLGEALSFLDKHPESQVLLYDTHGKLSFHLIGAGDWKFTHHGTFSLGSILYP
jgi:thiamine pyrophosphokinase